MGRSNVTDKKKKRKKSKERHRSIAPVWMVCYSISRSISPCTTVPSTTPTTSATMSFQHQWLPSVPSSCTSLATATTAATMGQMTARTRHTPKCFTLSLPVHESSHIVVISRHCLMFILLWIAVSVGVIYLRCYIRYLFNCAATVSPNL